MRPSRDQDDNGLSGRRRRGGGLFDRLRGSNRTSGSTTSTSNSRSSKSNSFKNDENQRRTSVLDALETLRVKSTNHDDDDDRTVLTSESHSLAPTVSTSSTISSGTSTAFTRGTSPFVRQANNPFLQPRQGMGQQEHMIPSLSSRPFVSTLPTPTASLSLPGLSAGVPSLTARTHSRTPSPTGGEVRKRIRTTTTTAATRTMCTARHSPSRLYDAVSSNAPISVVRDLLNEDPDATSQQNPGGMTPLHCAIERYDTDLEMLLLMLSYNPSAAGIRNVKGLNCVDLMWKRFIAPEPYRSEAIKQSATILRRTMEEIVDSPFAMHRQTRAEHCIQEHENLKVFWDAIVAFINGACEARSSLFPLEPQPRVQQVPNFGQNSQQPQMLHKCVRLDCDPLLIKFVAAMYPQQIREQTSVAEQSRLPLHLAALQSSRALTTVLALLPRLASQTDGDGRLPIHLAIETGIEWDGGIEALVRASPKSLSVPDPITDLLPVMLAATTEDLTTVFSLMTANPVEVVNYALRR